MDLFLLGCQLYNSVDASSLRKMIYQPLNLALFYAHPKPDSGQFEEEEEGADWPRAVLCFRLFSSRAFPNTFQIYLLSSFDS